jgi:hypothetical protein
MEQTTSSEDVRLLAYAVLSVAGASIELVEVAGCQRPPASTASCEPGPHYSVPAGRYEVVVPLDLNISREKRTLVTEGCIAVVL